MNKLSKQLLVMMSLCAFNFVMHAELLVVKKGDQGFVSLNEKDEVNKAAIADVFLKYEWPMVIANTALTKQEQDELLTAETADKPYAEEMFIRKKLKEIDEHYDVVFIPTALYELFALSFYKKNTENPLSAAISNMSSSWIDLADLTQEDKDVFLAAASYPLAPTEPYEELTKEEQKELLFALQPYWQDRASYAKELARLTPEKQKDRVQSRFFYTQQGVDKLASELAKEKGIMYLPENEVILFTNKEISQQTADKKIKSPKTRDGNIDLYFLLNITNETSQVMREKVYGVYRENNNFFYPDAFLYTNNALLAQIFSYYPVLADYPDGMSLTNELENMASNFAARLINDSPSLDRMKKEIDPQDANIIKANGVLAIVKSLEYEARAANKALLLRGTSRINFEKGKTSGSALELMGSTIQKDSALLKSYKEGKIKSYSISFGNSLFAGWVRDSREKGGACSYQYFVSHGGYALFLDKKYYIKNQLMGPSTLDLFFIAPLAPLAALFANGEWFHSRTKAAIPFIEGGETKHHIMGIFQNELVDPHGVITTLRDPMIHAQLFSQYLAKNMRIIGKGDEFNLTDEEKKIFEDKLQQDQQKLSEAQAQAAKYYAAIPVLERFANKFHENPEATKRVLKELFAKQRVKKQQQQRGRAQASEEVK